MYLAILLAPFVGLAYAFYVEPHWLHVKTVRFSDQPRVRFVHFSDLHYGGERNYLRRVVDKINALAPDFACFTGDIGAPVLPYLVGEYEAGRYDIPAGPLYVNVGIGTFYLHVRFLCRPELTVIEL